MYYCNFIDSESWTFPFTTFYIHLPTGSQFRNATIDYIFCIAVLCTQFEATKSVRTCALEAEEPIGGNGEVATGAMRTYRNFLTNLIA